MPITLQTYQLILIRVPNHNGSHQQQYQGIGIENRLNRFEQRDKLDIDLGT